ncbi:MAG: ribonuclease R [Thermoanaerobaculum sp.]|nr:ribonuclease R [Thermoanaerobaculum sp.]
MLRSTQEPVKDQWVCPEVALALRKLASVLRDFGAQGASLNALSQALQLPASVLRETLALAEARALAFALPNGRWALPEQAGLVAGVIRTTAKGFGVLRPIKGQGEEVVVPPVALKTAMDGVVVLVRGRRRRQRRGQGPTHFGEVVQVVRRARATIVGRFVPDPVQPWVDPFARRLAMRVLVDPPPFPVAPQEFVEVLVEEYGEQGPISGRVIRTLGLAGQPGVDEEVVLAELGIPVEFPLQALEEAEALPLEVRPEDLEGRVDLRQQPAVTIDGETAKDFDDAVVAFPGPGETVEVFVHIADVSYYVPPYSALDLAARQRGCSVYLPGRCVPMFPERLSNHLCSLLPQADRLAFTVRFLVTPEGRLADYKAFRSVFCSRRRCTYTEVNAWLETDQFPPDLPAEVAASLRLLDLAARRLRAQRERRGSIDFDLPEPEILLDPEGFMTGVREAPRNRAHRLIEELMIAANEAVARLLVFGRQPGIFRVHSRPSPGKLAELQAVLEEFGVPLVGDLEELPAAELQRVLAAIEGRPEQRFLETLILRSLARAEYLPECRGHYALATDFYLHFTSPIRRYPDLVVHRHLADLLAGKRLAGSERELVEAELWEIAQSSSLTERRAEEAEREVVRWKQAEFMKARIGQEFSGHITGVLAFGFFVQLDEIFVEGLVHLSTLTDDRYRYEEEGHRLVGERTGRGFRLGDAVRVKVLGVDEETMGVDFQVVALPSPIAPPASEPAGKASPVRKDTAATGKTRSRRPKYEKKTARQPASRRRGR